MLASTTVGLISGIDSVLILPWSSLSDDDSDVDEIGSGFSDCDVAVARLGQSLSVMRAKVAFGMSGIRLVGRSSGC